MIIDVTNDVSALYAGFLSLCVLALNSFVNWLRNKKSKNEMKITFDSIAFQFDPENKESMSYKVNVMQKELITNGGSSVKDMVMKTHQNTIELTSNVKELKSQMRARMELQFDESMEPIFLCDEKGSCTFTNKALQILFGMSLESMLDFGWIKAIKSQQEKEIVHKSWMYSVNNKVAFNLEYTICNPATKADTRVVAYSDIKTDDDGNFMFIFGKVKAK